MEEYIAFDSHKRYTWVEQQQVGTGKVKQYRLEHAPGAIRKALAGCASGTPVAIEATANWYWIIDEIEQAGCKPRLVHARKAKMMMGQINKTDKLDAHGMNRLQQTGTLPTVWIPYGPLREMRELTRTRVVLVAQRTLAQVDGLQAQIREFEERLEELVKITPEMQRLQTMPGVGVILAATIWLEIGEIGRFLSAERLASYAGTTPRVHASGDRVRYGRTRPDVNRYLKWAFAEAANSVAVNYRRRPERHVSELYGRLRAHKGHAKAVGAVARHLAEAAFHVLSRQQEYRDPTSSVGRTREM